MVVTDATLAVTAALVTPAGMMTAEVTVTFKLPLVRVAGKPESGDGPLRLKVQAEVPGPVTVEGLQTRLVS